MNELVRLTTQDVGKGMAITDSWIVSEHFNKRHTDVIRSIENLITQNCELKNMFEINDRINDRGRRVKEYLISKDGFMLLVMGFTGKEALTWKLQFIKAFNFMEKELLARVETRHLGKIKRKELTDAINYYVTDEGNFKKFAFSNYSKLVYKKVLGKDVKKSKEERGVKEKENLRDFLNIEEIEKVQELESKIATYIEFTDNNGKTDKEIYQDVKTYIEK